jgi:hypothetical protein
VLPLISPHPVLPAGGERGLRVLRHLRRDPRRDRGRPGQATTTLVYKVFSDGSSAWTSGGSAAQSVVLMVIVVALTAVQFRYVERRCSTGDHRDAGQPASGRNQLRT